MCFLRTFIEDITSTYDDLGMKCERDAFDALFDHAPDKLQVVKKVCYFNILFISDFFMPSNNFLLIFSVTYHFCEQAFKQSKS